MISPTGRGGCARRRSSPIDPVDILVNNAGTIRRAPAAEHPRSWWDEVIQVDLSSQFVLTQAVAHGMLAARPGQDHLHGIAADLPGRHHGARVRRGEIGDRRTDQGAVQRVGIARRDRERDRTRLHRDGQHAGAAG